MDEATARRHLERMTAADVEPTLSEEEITDLLELSKRADSEDRAPSDDDWVETFDLDAGAAEGWRTKAGKAAPRFGVSLDGDSLQRQQIYSHCMTQAAAYAHKVAGSLGVRTAAPAVTEPDTWH